MSAQNEVATLLRFLTQDAKLPLAGAIGVTKALQARSLTTPALIASSDLPTLAPVFATQDDAKKALNAAKRKLKRPAGEAASPRKKRRMSDGGPAEAKPEELEAAVVLPQPVVDEAVLLNTTLITNRAPLLLTFCLVLLEYTMPRQPLSSRLSLAQAQVSQGARARAKDLGIESGSTAESEGWGVGQPIVKVMSKDIRVIRRPGYPLAPSKTVNEEPIVPPKGSVESSVLKPEEANAEDDMAPQELGEKEIAFWALDLEALKKSNTEWVPSSKSSSESGLPIYSPQSAKAYILKAFASEKPQEELKVKGEEGDIKTARPRKAPSEAKQKEENLARLLGALKLLFDSWAEVLDADDLSRRAWGWYVKVRPDVEHGAAGWGNKGEVKLANVLALRR